MNGVTLCNVGDNNLIIKRGISKRMGNGTGRGEVEEGRPVGGVAWGWGKARIQAGFYPHPCPSWPRSRPLGFVPVILLV